MTVTKDFIQKATKILEQQKPSFYLDQQTPGFSFTYEEPRILPAGKYVILEPDTRDNRRVIVLHAKTYRMYAIVKRMIPRNTNINNSNNGEGVYTNETAISR